MSADGREFLTILIAALAIVFVVGWLFNLAERDATDADERIRAERRRRELQRHNHPPRL